MVFSLQRSVALRQPTRTFLQLPVDASGLLNCCCQENSVRVGLGFSLQLGHSNLRLHYKVTPYSSYNKRSGWKIDPLLPPHTQRVAKVGGWGGWLLTRTLQTATQPFPWLGGPSLRAAGFSSRPGVCLSFRWACPVGVSGGSWRSDSLPGLTTADTGVASQRDEARRDALCLLVCLVTNMLLCLFAESAPGIYWQCNLEPKFQKESNDAFSSSHFAAAALPVCMRPLLVTL